MKEISNPLHKVGGFYLNIKHNLISFKTSRSSSSISVHKN